MRTSKCSPFHLFRTDLGARRSPLGKGEEKRIILGACAAILVGTLAYGFSFGIWRSPTQACYAAVKMPLLIFSVTVASSLINTMLAQVIGSGLSYRQVWICILVSLAITAALLGSLSPVLLFFACCLPPVDSADATSVYRTILLGNTTLVGVCGIVGNVQLYRLLRNLTASPAIACRVLLSWIFVSGLVGCELSWILSPFLAKPGEPVPLINPDAFSGNFFEYVWRAMSERSLTP